MDGHSSHHHYETRYYESAESIKIREQNALEEKNRKEASEELQKFLVIVQNEFSTKLKGKISKAKVKIEKELINCRLKKRTEKILQHSYKHTNHFNILLLGKTGVGKTTLINGIFDFSENEGEKHEMENLQPKNLKNLHQKTKKD
jgi:flagellar biosynthesis GTPase FlhF